MRLIDADRLKAHYAWWGDEDKELFDSIVDQQPTVDAVPVVRCRECKYWNPYKSHLYKGHYCDVVTLFVQENEYCAWGKRREDGADE